MRYTVVLEREEDGGYVASVPALPGCVSQGDNRAEALSNIRGSYTLQAAIAACHARSFRASETDWDQLVALYDELAQVAPSPIVELNRAVAVSMASGPDVALALVDELVASGRLERYHLLSSVRGDLLDKLGRRDEAAAEFERAALLATNAQERTLLEERAGASRGRVGWSAVTGAGRASRD